MADIIIAIIHFPNDPTQNMAAHQMFLAEQCETSLNLYSVSSIFGKERRVFGRNKDSYVTIVGDECAANGFRVPSFIDCTKMYQVAISNETNVSLLSQRAISQVLRQRIEAKIQEMKAKGRHVTYCISEEDFRSWNPKI